MPLIERIINDSSSWVAFFSNSSRSRLLMKGVLLRTASDVASPSCGGKALALASAAM